MKLGFAQILTLVFVVAKLAGHFDASWWVVFIPMYILMFVELVKEFTVPK